MRYYFLLLFWFSTLTLFSQSTVESVPNNKLTTGSYVSNPDAILDGSTVQQLDTLLRALEEQTSVQVAVVALNSIGGETIEDFAQQLFTRWGIGNKEKDNGLLILLVNDLRTIRFHTGYGLEGVLPDITCKRIQREYMVPEFKQGNYNAGVWAGLLQVDKILRDPAYAEELKKPENEMSNWSAFLIFLAFFMVIPLIIVFSIKNTNNGFADSKSKNSTPYPELLLTYRSWLLTFVGVPVLIVALFGITYPETAEGLCILSLYFYFFLTLFYRLYREKKVIRRFLAAHDYYEIVEFLRKYQWYWLGMAFLFPPFFFYFFYHLMRKRLYRNHPRACKKCQGAMKKLSEKADDEYLTEGQRLEEKIRSVDYDVWKCKECESIEMWFYLNRYSKYTPCPKCKTIAFKTISKRTLVSPTYSSSGSGEETSRCSFCHHEKKSTYSIAMLVASSSSSSSGGSSSGGSWGGGSSGGGGASSSW